MIDPATQNWLLHVARQSLFRALVERHGSDSIIVKWKLPWRPSDPLLDAPGRAFVSWYLGARLVGCIGTLEAREPLQLCVERYAVQAGLHDPRTPPAVPEDWPNLRCEISILSDPKPLGAEGLPAIAAAIEPGRDGVVLRQGSRRSVFLPSVWDKLPTADEFLTALCKKGRIDPGDTGSPITAEVFTVDHLVDDPHGNN